MSIVILLICCLVVGIFCGSTILLGFFIPDILTALFGLTF